jgi:hypothetical protein
VEDNATVLEESLNFQKQRALECVAELVTARQRVKGKKQKVLLLMHRFSADALPALQLSSSNLITTMVNRECASTTAKIQTWSRNSQGRASRLDIVSRRDRPRAVCPLGVCRSRFAETDKQAKARLRKK